MKGTGRAGVQYARILPPNRRPVERDFVLNRKRMSSSLFKFVDRYSKWPRRIRGVIRDRNYHRCANEYLDAVITPRFGLKSIRLIVDHRRRKLYRAETDDGPVALKLYLDDLESRVAMQQRVYPLFEAAGLDTPPFLHAQVGEENANRYRMSFLVTRWIEGKHLDRESPKQVREAIQRLAHLHSIGLGSLTSEEMPKSVSSASTDSNDLYALERSSATMRRLRRAGLHLSKDSRHRILETFREGIIRIEQSGIPDVLVHLDFGPHNLLRDADGRIYVLDLDNLRAGCFGFDLATALLFLTYGSRSLKLTRDDFEAIVEPQPFRELLDAYFESAPEWTQDAWRQFRALFMLWAYFNTIGTLANNSWKARLYDRTTRAGYRRGAEISLRKVEAYLRSGRDLSPSD